MPLPDQASSGQRDHRHEKERGEPGQRAGPALQQLRRGEAEAECGGQSGGRQIAGIEPIGDGGEPVVKAEQDHRRAQGQGEIARLGGQAAIDPPQEPQAAGIERQADDVQERALGLAAEEPGEGAHGEAPEEPAETESVDGPGLGRRAADRHGRAEDEDVVGPPGRGDEKGHGAQQGGAGEASDQASPAPAPELGDRETDDEEAGVDARQYRQAEQRAEESEARPALRRARLLIAPGGRQQEEQEPRLQPVEVMQEEVAGAEIDEGGGERPGRPAFRIGERHGGDPAQQGRRCRDRAANRGSAPAAAPADHCRGPARTARPG